MVRASLILSGALLAMILALFYWLSTEADAKYVDIRYLTLFDGLKTDHQIILESYQDNRDIDALISTEQNLSSDLRFFSNHLDPGNELRERIWQLADLNYAFPSSVDLSRYRLKTVYTHETLTTLDPLILELEASLRRTAKKQQLRFYLTRLMSLQSISLEGAKSRGCPHDRVLIPVKPLQG